MNSIVPMLKKSFFLFIFFVFSLNSYSLGSGTYYIKAGVKSTGNGKVYISKDYEEDIPSSSFSSDSKEMDLVTQKIDDNNYSSFPTGINYYFYAQPDDGYFFQCWRDANDKFIDNVNPAIIKIYRKKNNQNATSIKAYFSKNPTSYDSYYRLKSATSNKYLSLTGEYINIQGIIGAVGGASDAAANPEEVINQTSKYIKRDMKLKDADLSDPSMVFTLKRDGDLGAYDIVGQGLYLKKLASGIYHGTNAGDNTITCEGVTLTQSNSNPDRFTALISMTCSGVKMEAYLSEENGEIVTKYKGTNDEDDMTTWILEPLTEASMESSYFGAGPLSKITAGGYYYTTMYTSFPYQLKDGVKAYYVRGIDESNKVECVEIENIVPAFTAVILECSSTNPKENRLIPYIYDVPAVVSRKDNLLKGVIDLDNGGAESTYRTANDQNNMRVLNVNSQGKLGFYKLSSNTTYMTSNKAYLSLPSSAGTKDFSLTFVNEGDATGIINVRNSDDMTTPMQGIYDLQGRKIENPVKGLYIINGKKVLIK